MRHLLRLFFVTAVFVPALAMAQTMESANDAVANMRVGWNLGNTLESKSNDTTNMWIEAWTPRKPENYETAWGQVRATPELMQMMHDAGFNAIRVPVTWFPHMKETWKLGGSNGATWSPSADPIDSTVNREWMKRVHEVVDYVINTGMYCILNVHHDTGADNNAWLVADGNTFAKTEAYYKALWRQIANEFKDYGDHLVFEAYNEMLDKYDSWCFASFAAPGRYNKAVADDAYNAINNYAQTFVDVVRSTGGNNSQRNLIVNTYGSCDGRGNWNTHLTDPLTQMKRPTDSATGHIIFEVHSYPDVSNLQNAKNEVDGEFNKLTTYLASKGAPVIIGEWGASDGNAYTNNKQNLIDFARCFVENAKSHGFTTFYWMGLSDGQDRAVPQFTQPDLRDAIIKGYYGEGGYTGIKSITSANESVSQHDGAIYNVMGQRLNSVPQHGIYIRNGKKYVAGK